MLNEGLGLHTVAHDTHVDRTPELQKLANGGELTNETTNADAEFKSDNSNSKEVSQAREDVEQAYQDDTPDGGLRAWLVIVGVNFASALRSTSFNLTAFAKAASGTFATFGYVNTFGVFQSYYEETVMPTTSPSTISWIGSAQYALIFVPGLLTGRLYDKGHVKLPLAVASALLVTSTFLTAECTEYWQFLLCQGILAGLTCGVIFGPSVGVTAHWFKRKRGIALGVISGGSSIGGTVFPIAARHLIQDVGFKWTMRILGFIQLFALSITCLTVARRLPPSKAPKKLVDFTIFKSLAYTIYCVANLVSFLGLYTVLTYIDVSAVHAGLDPNFTYYLVAIANVSSGFGRITAGFIADRTGPLNILIPGTTIAAVLTYAWPFAKTTGDFVAIAIIYGLFSAVYVSLLPAPIMAMGNQHNVGIMVGVSMTILAAGAISGPPISGAINASTGGFKSVGYYAGSMILASVALLIVTRQTVLKGRIYGRA
ncbi:hypothetical protein EIP91_004180 [Steccherinum ochraceum]|uniref:Major facilitator superfamily (MFS) profile domain-containing protein n=1 Tax=Steccherinum ochraceum TaxID=92696 RepID=A0A4R0RWL1_9APHY|nr:hypothetical protein EIP91_004180 [Steccherinum ochraceum]